jgi:hypothetical protein
VRQPRRWTIRARRRGGERGALRSQAEWEEGGDQPSRERNHPLLQLVPVLRAGTTQQSARTGYTPRWSEAQASLVCAQACCLAGQAGCRLSTQHPAAAARCWRYCIEGPR